MVFKYDRISFEVGVRGTAVKESTLSGYLPGDELSTDSQAKKIP